MGEKLTDLSEGQREALLDLVMLAMYADGHLTSVEDARVERLLSSMGYTEVYDQQRQFDNSVTRVRQYSESPERALAQAATLAKTFVSREHRRLIYALLEELISSDAHITAVESKFLETVRAMFRL